jgi:hypothetical protein
MIRGKARFLKIEVITEKSELAIWEGDLKEGESRKEEGKT